MEAISKIMLYVIGTFLSYKDLNNLSLTSKTMNEHTGEAKKLLAKREVMRIFSSDLSGFRMIIHSVSNELGLKDYSTPTLNDGHNWLNILKEGLMLKNNWSLTIKKHLESISTILVNPENNLPSFQSNNLAKLETTMQEHLLKESGALITPNIDILPQVDIEFDNFNELENIYLLHAYYYKKDSSVAQNSPKISKICQFHNSLFSYVKFC